MRNDVFKKAEPALHLAVLLLVLFGLYFTTRVNYLLFHSLVEGFSIVVGSSIFIVAWNSKKYIRNPYLLFVGIAYLFIALLDMLHTLSYKGMALFTDYDYYANQLWIGARYMESVTLLLAFIFLRSGKVPKVHRVFAVYAVISSLIIASIFYWKIFPECFVEGMGQTAFKKNSEYIICLILLAAIFLLIRNRERFERKVYLLLLGSMVFTAISELAFTFYISNYGLSNLVGHYFKIMSFILVYEAIVKTGIEKPYELIFLELDQSNRNLSQEIEFRIKIQHENEQLIDRLKKALDEINTLEGILPLCSFCKKIRDEEGHWEQVDVYIYKHSEADISHSVCPDCMEKHYPDI
jgi:hypothetical protein